MKKLIEKITNGNYKEPFIKNKRYSVLYQEGVNVEQFFIYEGEKEKHIITINVYPHEKVEIITYIPWGSPEVEEVKGICKELYRDLEIYLMQEVKQ